jgi:drug/metabolite transporter (DMT)-like permease
MRTKDLILLLLLAAIWGASFLFMRVLAPAFGVAWTAELRCAIAGLAMLAYMIATGQEMQARTHWKSYFMLGIFSSALPACLFVYAALTLPSGYSAILNATSALWGTLIGAFVLDEKLTGRKIAGLLLGIMGVALVVRLGPIAFTVDVLIAALACIAAAVCYGIATTYTKKKSVAIPAPLMATGSQLAAALVVLPLLPFSPAPVQITPWLVLIMLALALLCSGLAYFIYFRLIVDVGPAKALTVTFLIPVFALVWGWLFLHETINLNALIGCGMVVLATWLVVFHATPRRQGAQDLRQ